MLKLDVLKSYSLDIIVSRLLPENRIRLSQAFRMQCICVRGNQTNLTFLHKDCSTMVIHQIGRQLLFIICDLWRKEENERCVWQVAKYNIISTYLSTYCLPWGSASASFSKTFISSLAASLYLSTFLMILSATDWSLRIKKAKKLKIDEWI